MNNSISQDFMLILNKFRKLSSRKRTKDMMHMGGFMMLSAIQNYMKNKGEETKENGVKVSELSALMHSTKPATSKMLNSLEEKGYIARVSDSKDRRIVYVKLTENGEAMIQNAHQRLHNFMDRTIKRMGEEDAKELVRMLNKLYDAMTVELKAVSPENGEDSKMKDVSCESKGVKEC